MTSSLRNSLHRRNHRERSQPAHRAKFGVLEKHKDYVLRARDYHAKQDRIRRLKLKAADRNQDEFYFAMKNERTVEGVHVKDRGNVAMPVDMVALLKSQDQGYIRTVKSLGLKKIDRIKRQLTDLADLVSTPEDDEPLEDGELEILRAAGVIATHGAQKRSHPKHIVFAEDPVQAQQHPSPVNKVALAESSDKIDLGWKTQDAVKQRRRRRKKQEQVVDDDKVDDTEEKDVKSRKRLLKELAGRLARDTQLSYALRELEMQRLLVGKGGRKKIRGAELVQDEDKESESADDDDDGDHKQKSGPSIYKPRVYKWRVERKR